MRERERKRTAGERQREREKERERRERIPSRPHPISTDPNTGFDLRNCEIMT